MKATKAVLFLLVLSVLSFADQVEEVSVQIGTISQFVKVGTDLKFDSMLPGYSYKGTLDVTWAVSSDSLQGIEQDEAQLFFLLASRSNDSAVTFIKDGKKFESVSGVLKCAVKNGECAEGSQLSETIGVQVKVGEEGKSLVEVIVLNASSKPIGGEQEKIFESNNVNAAIGEVVGRVGELVSENDSEEGTSASGEEEPVQGSVQGEQAEEDANAYANELSLSKNNEKSAPEPLLNQSNMMWAGLAAFLVVTAGYTAVKFATRKKGFGPADEQ